MVCMIWVDGLKGHVTDVQWGPFGFQATPVPHHDPLSGRDCRVCRHTLKQATQAGLTGKKIDLDIMGIFTVRMTETGRIRMVANR